MGAPELARPGHRPARRRRGRPGRVPGGLRRRGRAARALDRWRPHGRARPPAAARGRRLGRVRRRAARAGSRRRRSGAGAAAVRARDGAGRAGRDGSRARARPRSRAPCSRTCATGGTPGTCRSRSPRWRHGSTLPRISARPQTRRTSAPPGSSSSREPHLLEPEELGRAVEWLALTELLRRHAPGTLKALGFPKRQAVRVLRWSSWWRPGSSGAGPGSRIRPHWRRSPPVAGAARIRRADREARTTRFRSIPTCRAPPSSPPPRNAP